MEVHVLIEYRYEEPRSLGSRRWGIFVSVQELDKNAFIEGYDVESENRGLGSSGSSTLGDLAICDRLKPRQPLMC